MRNTLKRKVAVVLVVVLVMSILPTNRLSMVQAAENYGISNPRVENGITTWDCIYFGNYWQEDTNGDGTADKNDAKTPIKWRVLSVDGDDTFLLADQNLDCQNYNNTWTEVTWETCTMRSWLNGYGADANICGTDYSTDNFLDNAFTADEQSAIKTTNVVNVGNPDFVTEGGNNTSDQVYLLSFGEVTNSDYGFPTLFSENLENRRIRSALNTAYAKEQGASTSPDTEYIGNGCWCLRSPGYNGFFVSDVGYDGFVSSLGNNISIGLHAVRPVLHLNLSSASSWLYAGTVTAYRGADEEATPAPEKPEETTSPSPMPTPKPTSSAVPNVTQSPSTSIQPMATQTDNPIGTPNLSDNVKTPTQVQGLTAKAKKNALQLKWKKISGASGYEVQYSTTKKFKKKTKKTTSKPTYTMKKLKRKKTYFVKVRAYAVKEGKKVYGKWSSVKICRVK